MSVRSYNCREIMKIPLPCEDGSLSDKAQNSSRSKIMEMKGHLLTLVEKLCVLSFDEIYITNKIDLDRKE